MAVLVSPRARSDLDEIWTYTADRWGIAQAEAYLRQIGRHLTELSERPELGRSCPEIRVGYYRFRSGSHVLFFRRLEPGIEVVRVLHGRMDASRQF